MPAESFAATNYDVKIHIKGSLEKIELFNKICLMHDHDWPYGDISTSKKCKMCGGLHWRLPRFKIVDLKALENQISELTKMKGKIKIKIHGWKEHDKCLAEWKARTGNQFSGGELEAAQ